MCGIVVAISERNVVPILLEGLRRLEYRGYDSAGIAVLDSEGSVDRCRMPGKVKELEGEISTHGLNGTIGIAHTRWATHGKPTKSNAHPHICKNLVAIVHNGIIENHDELRKIQTKAGYTFTSETDTEVVVHQIHDHHYNKNKNLYQAVLDTVDELDGAYALGVISHNDPDRLIATRRGSPLVIGVGFGEYFIASDSAALLPVTQRFIYLEDGDIADITRST